MKDKSTKKNNNSDVKPKVYFEDEIDDLENNEKRFTGEEQTINFDIDESPDDIPFDAKTHVDSRGQIGEWPFRVEDYEEDQKAKKDDFAYYPLQDIRLDDPGKFPSQPSDIKPNGIYEPEQKPPLELSPEDLNSPHIPAEDLFNPPRKNKEPIEPVNIDSNPYHNDHYKQLLNEAARLKTLKKDEEDTMLATTLKQVMETALHKQRISSRGLQEELSLTRQQAEYYLNILSAKGLLEKFNDGSQETYFKPAVD